MAFGIKIALDRLRRTGQRRGETKYSKAKGKERGIGGDVTGMVSNTGDQPDLQMVCNLMTLQ